MLTPAQRQGHEREEVHEQSPSRSGGLHQSLPGLEGTTRAQRLRELIELFEQRILDSRTKHLNHFFDEEWRVRSDSYTFGHDIEATWLLCEAAEVLGDAGLLEQVEQVALPMAEVVLKEGIDTDGALRYEGRGGKIIDGGKECWPQAEAVIGFLNACQISVDEKYLNAALRAWDFIENHLVDRVRGEWFWRITPEGKVDATLRRSANGKAPITRPGCAWKRSAGCAPSAGQVDTPADDFLAQTERGLSSIRSGDFSPGCELGHSRSGVKVFSRTPS